MEVAKAKKNLLSNHHTLKNLKNEERELERALETVHTKKTNCDALIIEATTSVKNAQVAVSDAKEKVACIEESTMLTEEDEASLRKESLRGI